MVGGFLARAGLGVDAAGLEAVGGLRGEEDVVDADAPVLLVGAGLIVPEGVEAGALVDGAQGVGEAEVGDAAEGGAGVGQEEGVAGPDTGSQQSFGSGITL